MLERPGQAVEVANSDGIDDSDLPTKPLPVSEPLPVGEPVAGHVPITELPTAPLTPPEEALASPGQSVTTPAPASRRRVWPWVIGGVLAVAAMAALAVGLNVAGGVPSPVPSTSISSFATASPSPSPTERKGGAPKPSEPAPNPQPTQPTAPPTPTSPPTPTGTPSP